MELLLLLLYNRAYLFSVFAYLGFKNSFAYSHNGFNLQRRDRDKRRRDKKETTLHTQQIYPHFLDTFRFLTKLHFRKNKSEYLRQFCMKFIYLIPHAKCSVPMYSNSHINCLKTILCTFN